MINYKRGEGSKYGPIHIVVDSDIRSICGVIIRNSVEVTDGLIKVNMCKRCNKWKHII